MSNSDKELACVVAIHGTTGKQLWSFQSQGWLYGSAVSTSQFVFVGSQDKHYYCLDKKTGKEVWKYKTKSRIESGGAVDEKFVYFASCDGSVYCLNQSDGGVRWEFAADLDEDRKKSSIYSVPLLHKGSVFFAACEGHVYGVDQETGKLKWKLRPLENSELCTSLATDGKLFFLTSRLLSKGRGEDSLIAIGLK
jgi:eukaryotic-like serine/threonine-protein kinase